MESEQFEKYQEFTEKTIYELSQKVTMLEKKLDMFSYLLEISKYINQYIKDPNLFPLINDMLIGVFGADHSTIFIKRNDEFYEAVSESNLDTDVDAERELIQKYQEEEFLINSLKSINNLKKKEDDIHSCIGVPVRVDNRLIGFILLQHREFDYFTKYHTVFLSLIGNHIGVAIENNFLYKQIQDSAFHDGLTDIFNKRYFFETLNRIANLEDQNYSIIIVDLDDFKSINDTYGHPMGDAVLKTVARILQSATRGNDIVARYGGDEIIIFVQNFTDKDKILRRVEMMREKIEKTVINCEGVSISITASFGVYVKDGEHLSLDEVIRKADEIMYLSKNSGKNKVSIS